MTGPVTLASNSLTSGIVLCVPFTEGTGTTVKELVSNSDISLNTGNSFSWTTSAWGTALTTTGGNDYIGPCSLTISNHSFTMAAIFKPGVYDDYRAAISTESPHTYELRSHYVATPEITCGYNLTNWQTAYWQTPMTSGDWGVFIGTASSTVLAVSLNGASDHNGVDHDISGLAEENITSLYLMGRLSGGGLSGGNAMALAVVWNRALSDTEIYDFATTPTSIFAASEPASATGSTMMMDF